MVHNIVTYHDINLFKQKPRKFNQSQSILIKNELKNIFKDHLIKLIHYPKWAYNMVCVSRSNHGIRICMEFCDLNKECPKDDFPLPNIDILVDNNTRYEILSLMDSVSSYNQILISPKDQQKMAFTIP